MRRFSLFVLSISLIAIYSASVYAGSPKGEVCAPLKADGITKGLYGLCVAYHSGSNNQKNLDQYNNKKGPSDPVMPGTDDNPPTLNCACWSTLTAEDIGADQENTPPSGCFLSLDPDQPGADQISYQNLEGGNSEILYVDTGACFYYNSATGAESSMGNLNELQEGECRLELMDFAVRDFGDFTCE